jgi:hypothetical protein
MTANALTGLIVPELYLFDIDLDNLGRLMLNTSAPAKSGR